MGWVTLEQVIKKNEYAIPKHYLISATPFRCISFCNIQLLHNYIYMKSMFQFIE